MIKVLREELVNDPEGMGYTSMSYPEIADYLNDPGGKPNPEPQGRVPRPCDFLDVLELLDPNEATALYQTSLKDDLDMAFVLNDRRWINALLAVVKSQFSPGTMARIANLLSLTDPDPDWSPLAGGVSRAEQLGLPEITSTHVQAALN